MRILVLQHVAIEHPGVFREFWTVRGDTWQTVELDQGEQIPSFDRFDLMVVMGGPMDVWHERHLPWLTAEKAAIRKWVKELERPFLGICLGHQLLADALGGKVIKMADAEVGVVGIDITAEGQTDRLLVGSSARVEALQWHGAEISTPPPGTSVLATNAASPVQAMRWGKHAYGFQYHVEITATTVSEWNQIPEYKASLERALGTGGAAHLESNVASKLAEFRAAARLIDENLRTIVTSARL